MNVSPTYAFFARFAQTWGLVYFFAIFIVVLVYALWPANSETFKKAADSPLHED